MTDNSIIQNLLTLKNEELIDYIPVLKTDEIISHSTNILYALYNLPKWINNVKFVDALVAKMTQEAKTLYRDEICKMWTGIDVYRKDKYLYLMSKMNEKNIVEIIESDMPLEMKCYFLRNLEMSNEEIKQIYEYCIEGDIAILKTIVDRLKGSLSCDKKHILGCAKRMKSTYKKSVIAMILNK